MYSYVLEVVFFENCIEKQQLFVTTFFIVWGISMNSYGYNNHNKLLISKFIVLIADYISIVLGTLAAYHLRLNLPFLPVSPHFKVDEIYVYGVIPACIFSYIATQ